MRGCRVGEAERQGLVVRRAQRDGERDPGDERALERQRPEEALVVAGQAELHLVDAVAGVVENMTLTSGEYWPIPITLATDLDVSEGDTVEVSSDEDTRLSVRWRAEESRFELRNGFLGVDRLATSTPTMLLGDVERDLDGLVTLFLDRPELRSRLAVCDLDRLERLGTVRSSAFVYFEWFLRDAYGVKLMPVPAFTQGLIDRGIISLGMG